MSPALHRRCSSPQAKPDFALKAVLYSLAILLGVALSPDSVSSDDRDHDDDAFETPGDPAKPAEDPRGPRRHFRVRNPAAITDAEAETIYARLKSEMARDYKIARYRGAAKYQSWRRYNRAPFRSATHGRRLVNHYANAKATAYGRYEKAGKLPVGAIIAKDSIAATADGKINPGPLFLMEKMPAGFNYASSDWRYTMIMPDGSVFGVTNGEGSQKVKFCVPCHLAVEQQDHVFFPPKAYRKP